MFGKKTQDNFLNYTSPFTFYYPAIVQGDVFRASQSVISNEKYSNWVGISDIVNHRSLSFVQSQIQYFAQLDAIEDATVKANMLEFPEFPLTVNFKDPWLIDDDSDPLGLRNRGVLANPLPLDNTQNNVGINTNHQGVLLNQNSQFDPNLPYYSIEIPSSIYFPQTGQTHNLYLQSWDLSGASLEDENSLTTGVVFTSSGGATITANVKATQLSDNQNAFNNNSQRKFIRTPDFTNTLHMVYESMGHVYYETSTDNGENWKLMNSGHPLDNGGGKNPSIDWVTINGTFTYIVIVFQQTEPGTGYQYSIQANVFGGMPPENFSLYPKIQTITIYNSGYQYTDIDADPVVAMHPGVDEAGIDIVWHINSGLKLQNAAISLFYNPPFNLIGSAVSVTGTNSSSIHPSLATDKYSTPATYHLAWEQQQSGYFSDIEYFELSTSGDVINPTTPTPDPETPSSGCGFWTNSRPSITALDNNTPRLTWIGFAPWYGTRAVFRAKQTNGSWGSTSYNYGSNVESVNINRTDEDDYAFGWSQLYDYPNKYVKNSNLWTIHDFGTTGKDIQICNAANFYNMYCLAFQSHVTLPYRFVQSSSVGSLQTEAITTTSSGRASAFIKDSSEFIYAIGDIMLNDEIISFIEVNDTTQINSQQILNKYMVTEPFQLNENSTIAFNIASGVTNPKSAKKLLKNGKYVSFQTELVDTNTGEVINSFANLVYNKRNVGEITNLSFIFHTTGAGIMNVHMRVLLNENISGEYALSHLIGEDSVINLGKGGYQEVFYEGNLAVTEYALGQNYPNPFNPSTTLKYQIPQNGLVTLKVYDILGKEVATLVNEEKPAGSYEVEFDASNLSSGIYFYNLKSGAFVETKKMILLR